MNLSFTKMNGAGNDFIMVDNRAAQISLSKDQIARLCDRHRGVGADGLICAEPASSPQAHLRMRYYNADGGEAEMCGNGARCFSRFGAGLLNLTQSIRFETLAGDIEAELLGEAVRLTMSAPHSHKPAALLPVGTSQLAVHFINTGVPHAVIPVADLTNCDVHELGKGIRYHDHFAPKGTNANFIASSTSPEQDLIVRTYERGVEGETLACGTGVVASALIHHLQTGKHSPIRVRVAGGDVMEVAFEKNNHGFHDVTLTGPADLVFTGSVTV
jgi:diaminopimelate epimerase